MGTTVVATLVREDGYIVGWVGDSRVYLVHDGKIRQLTVDHSLVQEQVNRGLITAEQAETSEFKNILTRALGAEENVEVDVVAVPPSGDDYLILCSDGLTKMLGNDRILETVLTQQSAELICKQLVDMANAAGGRDNVTVVVVHNRQESFWKRFIKSVAKAE
jgi:protein phosphatase